MPKSIQQSWASNTGLLNPLGLGPRGALGLSGGAWSGTGDRRQFQAAGVGPGTGLHSAES